MKTPSVSRGMKIIISALAALAVLLSISAFAAARDGAKAATEAQKAYSRKLWSGFISVDADYSAWDAARINGAGVKKQAKAIVSGLSDNSRKIMAVVKFMAENVYFDYDYAEGRTSTAYTAPVDVLIHGYAPCDGFSNTCQALLQSVGVPCVRVSVTGDNSGHSYNAAWTGDRWLLFDASWCTQNTYRYGQKNYGGAKMDEWYDFSLEYGLNSDTLWHNITSLPIMITDGTVLAFETCASDVVLNSNITAIGEGAFGWSGIKTLTGNKVTKVGDRAFYVCRKLKKVSLPLATNVGGSAFAYCTALKNADIPKVNSLGDEAFYGCSSLTDADFPALIMLGERAFNYNGLISVNMPVLLRVPGDAFSGAVKLQSANLESITAVPDGLFSYCAELETVKAPKVTSVGDSAFSGCKSLKALDFPKLTSAGVNAFAYCASLENVELPALVSAGESAFWGCASLKSVKMPLLAAIPNAMFGGAAALKTVSMNSLTDISDFAFSYCAKLTGIEAPKVTAIGAGAFLGCKALESVNFPNAVSAGDGAFSDCDALLTLDLPALTSAGDNLACWCESLKSVNLPLLRIMSECMFTGDAALKSVSMASLESVSDYAFGYCANLAEVCLPAVETIGEGAFSGCAALAKADYPKAKSIGGYAFSGCAALKYVNFPALEYVGESAFNGCKALARVDLPCATEVGDCAFYQCEKLEYASLPLITAVNSAVFYGASALSGADVSAAESLSYSAFAYCAALPNISLPRVKTVGAEAFYYCGALKSVGLPVVESMGSRAFAGCYAFSEITLPASLGIIGEAAFEPDFITLNVVSGSYAHNYALTNGIPCAIIGSAPVTDPEIPVAAIIPDVNEAWVAKGWKLDIGVTVEPANASNSILAWTTSDPSVATVSGAGRVMGVGGGVATITVSATDGGGARAEIKVTVIDKLPAKITLNKQKVTLKPGKSITLKATVKPKDAQMRDIIWSSSDENVATVNQSGKVKAVGAGKATITARTLNDLRAECVITVKDVDVKKISIDSTAKITIKKGEALGKTLTLSAKITPDNASIKTLKWKSSDESVATVDENGVVTSVGFGKCTVTASAADGSGVKAKCRLTVEKRLVKKLEICGKAKMTVGATQQLTVKVSPGKAYNQAVKWKSSDEAIATVDENGYVTAHKKGTVTITAASRDGGKVRDTFEIKVKKK